jgi:molybdate transport system substrate-binding protein
MMSGHRNRGFVMRLCDGLLALLLASSVAQTERDEIMVYAAASLRDVLEQMRPDCERAADARLVFNFGASNDLARQIQAGNKADVFLSADEAWMDAVEKAGLVDPGSRRSLLSNRLVVVGPLDGDLTMSSAGDLGDPRVRRLSVADPSAVPAGKYAKAWLEKAGRWEAVKDRIVPALDVRAALAAVESGAAEVGIVYKTDAAISKKVRVLFEVPEPEGPRISYPLAVLRERPHVDSARRVAAWLVGSDAARVFERFGFVVKPATP